MNAGICVCNNYVCEEGEEGRKVCVCVCVGGGGGRMKEQKEREMDGGVDNISLQVSLYVSCTAFNDGVFKDFIFNGRFCPWSKLD